MYGAILGDMIGAPYEFDRGKKTKDFTMFGKGVEWTDDSVMTFAVAEALLDARDKGVETEEAEVKKLLVAAMRRWGKKYPFAGYGGRFAQWLRNHIYEINRIGNNVNQVARVVNSKQFASASELKTLTDYLRKIESLEKELMEKLMEE